MVDLLKDWWAQVDDAENKITRSVALVCASLLVASRNVGAEIRGEKVWNADDVIKASHRYEEYVKTGK
jgi:hypothetical protein